MPVIANVCARVFSTGGAAAMPDYELLEMVLFAALPRRDTKPLAKALLKRFGSFAEVIAAPRDRLKEIQGVGDSVVSQLKIVEAAAARLAQDPGDRQARAVLLVGAAGLLHGGDGARRRRKNSACCSWTARMS